jgi:hypothetical protein
MSTTYYVLTVLGAAMVGFSAVSVFLGVKYVVEPLAAYGIPRSWWPWLGTAKALGAAGLLAGLVVPAIGAAAGIALVLYFTGAVITVLRARWYAHVAAPLLYVAPVVGARALKFPACASPPAGRPGTAPTGRVARTTRPVVFRSGGH